MWLELKRELRFPLFYFSWTQVLDWNAMQSRLDSYSMFFGCGDAAYAAKQ